ncbi:putative sulfate/molybdate transporter [Thermodesulfovibrionales bacterium]|nr:putative sulfate/molybdate transporter [Thermodesulfovibrionales bacterium]MCL0072482.1 putative sulfate/molybdate transporter [Thermodesulfovibrionales bacterium]MCL0086334.1 putative sulfate/molybdate transporter [Thermodesulfovibrionales bacterium]
MKNSEERVSEAPYKRFAFNMPEFSGSLADLGTLLPLAIGMIVVIGLDPTGVFFMVGAVYLLCGLYYGVTMPVQPMKMIGAYAIAMGFAAGTVAASGLLIGLFMLFIGVTGAIQFVGKYIPTSVIRGIQGTVGVLLAAEGIKFILGATRFQEVMVEPHLILQAIGPIPISLILGVIAVGIVFLLLENKRIPAALVVIVGGMLVGAFMGTHEGMDKIELFHLPQILPLGMPSLDMMIVALTALTLPQIPLTIGNAVIASTDMAKRYFGDNAKRVNYKSISISMGLGNIAAFTVGGMPMCHGAGGLAAHYRFGSRTAGTNVIIGAIFLVLALLFGEHALAILYLLPFSFLGALLIFAGVELALMILDVKKRTDLFVALTMIATTLATNLAIAFAVGLILAYAFKTEKFKI